METSVTEVITSPDHLIEMTGHIVAQYVQHNTVSADEMADVIRIVHNALSGLSVPTQPELPPPPPAVPIHKSIDNDKIVCLDCGARLQTLKRHLRTHHDMAPEEYRAKWKLRSDYPIVAPSYSSMRSQMAMSIGLGRTKRQD
jgi:predicted transcriptional regulator